MEYVEITNFSPLANLHRNNYRPAVDKLFAKKQEKLDYLAKINSQIRSSEGNEKNRLLRLKKEIKEQINSLDVSARNLWRKIIMEANQL